VSVRDQPRVPAGSPAGGQWTSKDRAKYDRYRATTHAEAATRFDLERQYGKALYAPAGKRAAYERRTAASGKAFHGLIDHLEATRPAPEGHSSWGTVRPSELREMFR
jgi:hypothetical protein